ncbi:MAG: alkaline phosphatase family protein, partial [Anaerolineales bacterium]|nr:alkaline phosphatase family protein [Anaerolineales bacterium]
GPKPNPDGRRYLLNGHQKGGTTIFSWLHAREKSAALLNAYPEDYFKGIRSGKRIYSTIPLAITQAGFPLCTADDLYAGRALSADFTGEGWRALLKDDAAPQYTPQQAGTKLAELAAKYDFSFFEYWASDYAGHKQDMEGAVQQMETFDGVLTGLLEAMPDDLLVLLTSDHGNMEDLSTRKHTAADVPCLLIGIDETRGEFMGGDLRDLTHIAPAILKNILP